MNPEDLINAMFNLSKYVRFWFDRSNTIVVISPNGTIVLILILPSNAIENGEKIN